MLTVGLPGGETSNCIISAFGQLFFALPTELIVQVLLHLQVPAILAFRRVSRLCNGIVCVNESVIVRRCLQDKMPSYCVKLYPISDATTLNIRLLCTTAHRYSTSCRLALTIAEFVETEWMRCTTSKLRRSFRHDRDYLRTHLSPSLFTLLHCIERRRDCMLAQHKRLVLPLVTGVEITPVMADWTDERYDSDTILQALYTYELLIAVMGRLLRPPSYASVLERSLRGWMKEPASREQIMRLVGEGGIDITSAIVKQNPYATRRQSLALFLKNLDSGIAQRRKTWHALLYGPFSPPEEDLPERFWTTIDSLPWTNEVDHGLWSKAHALEDFNSACMTPKTYVCHILGYDIVERLRQSQTLQEQVQGRKVSEQEMEELRAADELVNRQAQLGGLDPWWCD